jgi:hypothetical protein
MPTMDNRPRQQLILPTAAELEASLSGFRAEWGAVDDVLYRLCRETPSHESKAAVIAKVALIERAYAAGLERQVEFETGQQPIVVAGEYVFENGQTVDQIIGTLIPIREPLTSDGMRAIVEAHGRFTDLLRGVTRKKAMSPRSFTSKYLHFHCPIVPIYDEYARQAVTRRVRRQALDIPFALPSPGDRAYWDYCVRFLRLYEGCMEAGIDVSVKSLDTCLWSIPVRSESAAES